MFLCDMHCDTLTACADGGQSLRQNSLQTDLIRLKNAGFGAQCFAIFTENCGEDGFYAYADFFDESMRRNADIAVFARTYAQIKASVREGKLACVLTAENLGFLSESKDAEAAVKRLYASGVRMASLVWNNFNGLACPNMVCKDGVPDFLVRESRGLTEKGRHIAELLDNFGIITDISHLSDGGAEELLRGRKKPLVASHSNAFSVHPVCRNLTDGQIKAVADCGGAVGVNFCLDFLGGGDALSGALAHIRHIISVGGEDCAALGGDLDGMLPQTGAEDCTKAAEIAGLLEDEFGARVAEKVCGGNFLHVFKEVAG